MKPTHSRNNSGHRLLPQQPDVSAILTELRTIKGFFMEQKMAHTKTESLLRDQLHYQKSQSDRMQQQLDIMKKMVETNNQLLKTLYGVDHRMMLIHQQVETRNIMASSNHSSNAPSELNAPSVASAPTGYGSPLKSVRHTPGTHSHLAHVATEPLSQHGGQSQHRVRQALAGGPTYHRKQQPLQDQSLQAAFPTMDKSILPPTDSTQSSRRPSVMALSEQASEVSTHTSPAHSPVALHIESMHSTPQAETGKSSSAPSSLSEQGSEESTVLGENRAIESAAKKIAKRGRLLSKRAIEDSESTTAAEAKKLRMGEPEATTKVTEQQPRPCTIDNMHNARRQSGLRELLNLGSTSEMLGSLAPAAGPRRAKRNL
jgi:hypothetical protein